MGELIGSWLARAAARRLERPPNKQRLDEKHRKPQQQQQQQQATLWPIKIAADSPPVGERARVEPEEAKALFSPEMATQNRLINSCQQVRLTQQATSKRPNDDEECFNYEINCTNKNHTKQITSNHQHQLVNVAHFRPQSSGRRRAGALATGSCPTARQKEKFFCNDDCCCELFVDIRYNYNAHPLVNRRHKMMSKKLPRPSLVQLLVLVGVLLLIGGSEMTSCYQLANNLIANNLPPKFVSSGSSTSGAGGGGSSEIVVRVKEGPQSIGKLVTTVKAEDPDDDPVTFGLLGSMASELFRIENVAGNQANVFLRKELDRETTESHQVVITLTDGKLGRGNWITKSMLIIVEDVNDNYPVFAPHKSAVTIREDVRWPQLIETLEATDQDEGRFGQVIYRLEVEEEAGSGGSSTGGGQQQHRVFSIETVDGRGLVSLSGPLDYEQRALYRLRVFATDRATESERLSSSTTLLVSVEDCEDQPPMFTFVPAITRVPEDLPVGTPILRVAAIDGDRGVNNKLEYALVSVNGATSGSPPFSMDPSTGQLSVARPLDRESSEWFSATTTSGESDSTGSATVTRSQQPGSYVLQVRATELASSASGQTSIGSRSIASVLMGSLLGSSTSSSSSNHLSRTLALTGSAHNTPTSLNSVTTELTVILTDVNDEPPTFDRDHYQLELLENSPAETLASFVGVAASSGGRVTDRDQGTNGSFGLHLEGPDAHLFEIWPREATNEASFMIKVASGGGSSSTASVQSELDRKSLDFERTKQLRFRVVARELTPRGGSSFGLDDTGSETTSSSSNRKWASAQVTVQLRDANDNYPQFESELYRVELPENAQRGMHVCVVRAHDPDSGLFGNQGIRYTELRGEKADKFRLDPNSGVVSLKTNEHGFDREQQSQYHLIVEARDSAGLGNRNTSQLLILLTDANDQKPKFQLDQYEALIYENEPDFRSPLQVQAVDGDAPNTANSRLTYSIVSGDPQSNFTIDQQTGRIRLRPIRFGSLGTNETTTNNNSSSKHQDQSRAGLDFEQVPRGADETRQFNLTVRAQDGGVPEPLWSTTQVLVSVLDRNDHAPVFRRQLYSKPVREDERPGAKIIQVEAADADESPVNSRISYRIASGAGDKFIIDPDSGWLSVAAGADLDIDRAGGRRHYLLQVAASDSSFGGGPQDGHTATCLVNITVTDINNKPPEFVGLFGSSTSGVSISSNSQPTTTATNIGQLLTPIQVSEDAPVGLILTRVIAQDLDASAELRYSIDWARSEARNEELALVEPHLFRETVLIDHQDGTIKLIRPLDRELFDQLKLRLRVEDLAAQTEEQLGHAQLTLKITDVNDNRPHFRRQLYRAVVNENSLAGTSILTVQADDRDLNRSLRYSLEGSPEVVRLIRINPRSGEITVNDKIDRELHPAINVTLRADDLGWPHSLTGSAQLQLTVRDENDNNPAFVIASNVSSFGSQTNTGSGSGSTSQYRQRSLVNSPVGIETGTAAELPLPILAPGATWRLSEDVQPGFRFARLLAEDPDLGANGRLTYLLADSTADHSAAKFRIDPHSGALSVATPLDRETHPRHTLVIEAADNYELGYATGESRRAFTQVHLELLDVNDNAPVISITTPTSGSLASLSAAAAGITMGTSGDDRTTTSLQPWSENQSQLHMQLQSSRMASGAPTYEDIVSSPGPYEAALADCLFISEFQPALTPILTITATDLDDPTTPGGQLELAIVNGGLPATRTQPDGADTETEPMFKLLPATSQSQKHPRSRRYATQVDLTTGTQATPTATSSTSTTNSPTTVNHSTPFGELQMHLVLGQSFRGRVGNYSLLVRATDGGGTGTGTSHTHSAPLSSVKLVNVCVLDVNDHPPVFSSSLPLNQTVRLMENATLGTPVIQLEASDLDHGHNAEIRFSLKSTNVASSQDDFKAFKIDRTSGLITTASRFQRNRQRFYTFRVEARDLGRPTSLASDLDMSVMIVSASKYQPEFEPNRQVQIVSFIENLQPNEESATLVDTSNLDDDPALLSSATSGSSEKTNKQITRPCYFIVDGDHELERDLDGGQDWGSTFRLDRYSHRLTSRKSLDRERRPNYTLIVQATNDCSGSSLVERSSWSSPLPVASRSRAPPPQTSTTSTAASMQLPPQVIDYRSGSDISPVSLSHFRIRRAPSSGVVSGSLADRKQREQPDDGFAQMLANDRSLLKVVIKVVDVNDNPPKFTQRIYTGGITTEADFGQSFMIVQAIDADSEPNNQVTYSLVKPIKRRLTGDELADIQTDNQREDQQQQRRRKRLAPEIVTSPNNLTDQPSQTNNSSEQPMFANEVAANQHHQGSMTKTPIGQPDNNEDLFVINGQTGELTLNFDPQRHMKGYFEFEVMARDPEGLSDSARVLIYLLRQDQRVKFVLRLQPSELRAKLNHFRSVMSNITGAIVNIDSLKYFELQDGTVDRKKSSLYLHFVNGLDNTIIEVDRVLQTIDQNIEYLDELYKEFHVLSSEAAHLPPLGAASGGALDSPADQLRTGLLGATSFLALILVLVVAICINQRTRYERQLKAATVSAFTSGPVPPPHHHLNNNSSSYNSSATTTTNHHHHHNHTQNLAHNQLVDDDSLGGYGHALPNTNLHSQEPNPIWMNGFEGESDWLTGSGAANAHKRNQSKLIADDRTELYESSETGSPAHSDLQTAPTASGKTAGASSAASGHLQLRRQDDSLGSSRAGRHSDSAGSSSSTTSDQRALCRRDQTSAGAPVQQATGQQSKSLAAVLKNQHRQPAAPPNISSLSRKSAQTRANQMLASGSNSTSGISSATPTNQQNSGHSTFQGTFKEVTIYTDHQTQRQRVPALQTGSQTNGNSLVSTIQAQLQHHQPAPSQVNKIASQFNAKHFQQQLQATQSNNNNNNHNNNNNKLRGHQIQQPKSAAMSSAAAAAASVALSRQRAINQQTSGLNRGGIVQSNKSSLAPVNQQQDQHQQHHWCAASAADNIENNLNKLSILNLETTEL